MLIPTRPTVAGSFFGKGGDMDPEFQLAADAAAIDDERGIGLRAGMEEKLPAGVGVWSTRGARRRQAGCRAPSRSPDAARRQQAQARLWGVLCRWHPPHFLSAKVRLLFRDKGNQKSRSKSPTSS